jgi:hypothetical protein
MFPRVPHKGRKVALVIKKEVRQFIIASEGLYRLLSNGEPLNCHEAEILNCCMDELAKRRLAILARPQKDPSEVLLQNHTRSSRGYSH